MAGELVSKEIEFLLEIADACEKGDAVSGKTIEDRLHYLIKSPIFKEYGLDGDDVRIIAVLFGYFLDKEDGMEGRDLVKKVGKDRKSSFMAIKRLERLRDIGILAEAEEEDNQGNPFITDFEGSPDGIRLLSSTLCLSNSLLSRIYGKEQESFTPYKDNFEYLADQFERIRFLGGSNDSFLPAFPIPGRFTRRRRIIRSRSSEEALKRLEKRIEERLKRTDKPFPFEELKKGKQLSRKEELTILALLEREAYGGRPYEAEELLDIISRTPHEKFQDKKLLDKDGRLVKEKMVEISSREHRFSDMEFIKLNDNLRMRLLEDNKRRNRTRLKRDDLFEVIKPSISLDKVILHPRTREEINLAVEMVRGKALSLLNEWGIKGSNLIHSALRKKQQPVTMLFYGAPGTGKSLTANAVAYALRRTLLTFDCSKILSAWVGESEQNTRRIFDRYKEIAKGIKNPPVLLLNEADQFLHRRINAARSVDHMYNQMQNIFLEQLEQFEGILIATTNLSENLDPAFSRRFHFKIEFRRPGPEERLRLWQVHMPEKAPLAEDVNLQYLAEHHGLSGGQIAVVVRNAATRAARRGDKIRQRDFIRACESEITGNFDERARGKVGF